MSIHKFEPRAVNAEPDFKLTKDGKLMHGPYQTTLFTTLNKALSGFVGNTGTFSASRMKVNRVVDFENLPDDLQKRYIASMRTQSDQVDVDGWLEMSGHKMLIMGNYIPASKKMKKTVLTKDAIEPKVHIDKSLNLSYDQFSRLYHTFHRGRASVCELKLLVDSMIDAGIRLVFRPPNQKGEPEYPAFQVTGCSRAELTPNFAWNAFYLVNPDTDKHYSVRHNDAACAVMWNQVNDPDSLLVQDLLRIHLEHPIGDKLGTPETTEKLEWLFDPTYNQVVRGYPFNINIYPFTGPGIDTPYINWRVENPRAMTVRDIDEPFNIRNLFDVVSRIEPLQDDHINGKLTRLYGEGPVVIGMVGVVGNFTGPQYIKHRMDEFNKLIQLTLDIRDKVEGSDSEKARRDAYYRNMAASMSEAREKEAARKARAAEERAAKAAQGEKPFTKTLPQIPTAKPFRRRQQTEEEKRKHEVHTKQKPIMTECFDKKQVREHEEAETRKAKQASDAMAKLESDVQKEIAAKTHYVPPPSKLSDFLDTALNLA